MNICEFCGADIQPDSLWMSNEAIYCSAACRKDGKELASETQTDTQRNGIDGWAEAHAARMARLMAAAEHDMELDRAEPTLWESA